MAVELPGRTALTRYNKTDSTPCRSLYILHVAELDGTYWHYIGTTDMRGGYRNSSRFDYAMSEKADPAWAKTFLAYFWKTPGDLVYERLDGHRRHDLNSTSPNMTNLASRRGAEIFVAAWFPYRSYAEEHLLNQSQRAPHDQYAPQWIKRNCTYCQYTPCQ